MPQAFAPVRPAAHPIPAANDAALSPSLVPSPSPRPSAVPSPHDPFGLHLRAANGFAQALHLLRSTELTAADLQRALDRGMRAVTALKHLSAIRSAAQPQ